MTNPQSERYERRRELACIDASNQTWLETRFVALQTYLLIGY